MPGDASRPPDSRPLPPAVCLMGPTASGKTGLAIELARRFPFELISVDSALVYRGMDIGTAKPGAEELARAPHRLIDIREPDQPYSAAEFRRDALAAMAEISRAGRVPLLVGGTMLYFRALLQGLSRLPPADPDVRRRLKRQAEQVGWPALHAELAARDPQAGARIDPTDPQRIQRALEVIELSGRTLTELQNSARHQPPPYRVLKLVVCPSERAELHRRIEQRFAAMLDAGFEEEVRRLRERDGLHPGLPALRAVGYRQAWAWQEGEFDRAEMRARALAATRQLAKRQLTWLRRENGCLWYDLADDNALEGVARDVRRFLEV